MSLNLYSLKTGGLILFLVIVIKYPEKKKLRGERHHSGYNSRLQSIIAWKSGQELETASHIISTASYPQSGKERKECTWLLVLSPLITHTQTRTQIKKTVLIKMVNSSHLN